MIAIASQPPANEISPEDLALPAEAVDGEMPEQTGSMPGSEGKSHTFTPQDRSPLPATVTKSFPEKTEKTAEQKAANSKGEARSFSNKKDSSPIRSREFHHVQKSKNSTSEGKKELNRAATTPHAKADAAARQTLQTTRKPPPPPTPFQMMQGAKPTLLTKPTPKGIDIKQAKGETKGENGKKSETRQQQKSQTRAQQEAREPSLNRLARDSEKTDLKNEPEKQRENEEEGFAEDERRQKWEEEQEGDERSNVSGVDNDGITPKKIIAYGNQDSKLLSEILKMRVSNFDVFALFVEVMKLCLRGREQERVARIQERELQLEHIQNMVDTIKEQGDMMFNAYLGSGVLGIVAGALPIVGHMQGDWIMDKFGGFLGSMRDMERDKLFEGFSKIAHSMSEMQRGMGDVRKTFAESTRTYDQNMAEMRKADWDETTRSMDELKDQWKNMEQFLHQSLQMYHEAVRQLYN